MMNTANSFVSKKYGQKIVTTLTIVTTIIIVSAMMRGAILCTYGNGNCPKIVQSYVWLVDDAIYALTGKSIIVYRKAGESPKIRLIKED